MQIYLKFDKQKKGIYMVDHVNLRQNLVKFFLG
jgi:hypothetical protein